MSSFNVASNTGMGMTLMHQGQLGEHLVCADLLKMGHSVSLASAGSPFDIVADVGSRLIRIQVKTTYKPIPKPDRPSDPTTYQFRTSHSHPNRRGSYLYTSDDSDLFAMITLDTGEVGYLPVSGAPSRLYFRVDDHSSCKSTSSKRVEIDELRQKGYTYREIADLVGVSYSYACSVVNGKAGVLRNYPGYLRDLTLSSALEKLQSTLAS